MKTIAQFIRTTILGGLFFLAPIVVLIVILAKAFEYAKKGLNAVLVHIPVAADLSAGAATALAVAVVALVCFLAGLVARTMAAQRVIDALKSSVLSKNPAYDYLKQESASALGVAEIGEHPVVFVPMEGGWQLGVQTEALSHGLVSVFVPGAPDPHFRVGLLLFEGQRQTSRRQAGRRAQLPQAMRRGRARARRQLADRGVVPLCEVFRRSQLSSYCSIASRSMNPNSANSGADGAWSPSRCSRSPRNERNSDFLRGQRGHRP